MKRKANVSNRAQMKASRNADRSMGRSGIQAANQKSANDKQHGNFVQHETDKIHLRMNKKKSVDK